MPTNLDHLRALAGAAPRYPDVVLDAIQPLGTVNSRKDGDWLKTEKGWVRITKNLKATIGTLPAGKPTSKAKKPVAVATLAPSVAPPAPHQAPPPAAPLSATAKAKAALKVAHASGVAALAAKTAPPVASPVSVPPAPAKVAAVLPAEDPGVKRAAVAAKIKPILLKVLASLGDGGSDDEATFQGKTVQASYRTWNLPKDPPSDPSDDDEDGYGDSGDSGMSYYDYEEKVSAELKNARAKITAALAGHMDSIAKIRAGVGDKNYVEVEVELK